MNSRSGRNPRFPPPSSPRAVDNGVRARSKRGAIGDTWWSGRFIQVLEHLGVGNRLQRGRTYARKGQVISLDIDAGMVSSLVQGSRARPYRVRIGLGAFGKAQWADVERDLAGNAWYLAKLLSGEMPDDIERVFTSAGMSLFPADADELSLDCSCPDWEVPCKHLAAVFYLLAESFDEDPFAIFAWRGREREDLLANLQAARSAGIPAADLTESSGVPLTERLDSFFTLQGVLPPVLPRGAEPDALLDQLPEIDLELRGRRLKDLLRPAYRAPGDDAAGEHIR